MTAVDPIGRDSASVSGMTRTVADIIIEHARALGVSTIFGVHGANVEHLFDAAVRAAGITPVVAKHEFAAGAMADGTARISGGYGTVLTTSGGGALNVLPALAEAYDSRVPVLAVIGTPPTPLVGSGAFQDMANPPDTIDLAAALAGVVGACEVISSGADIGDALGRIDAVLAARRPAALLVARDVQAENAVVVEDPDCVPARASVVPRSDLAVLARRLLTMGQSGASVVIWVGEEASMAQAGDEIDALAELLGAVTVAAPGGRDAIVDADRCAGVTGVMGHPSARGAVRTADLVLAIGTRMSMTDRAGLDALLAERPVVYLGTHELRCPAVESAPGTQWIRCADLRETVRWLSKDLRSLGARSVAAPTVTRQPLVSPGTDRELSLPAVIDIVGASLPLRGSVFADAGNTGAAAVHHLPFGRGRFVVALGMGGMGYAIAAGVGQAIASMTQPRRARTTVIAGDGAFMMHGMEIHTAVEYGAPITLIVLNNDAHGMCITREHLFFPDTPPPVHTQRSLNRFRHTDFAAGLTAMFPCLDVRAVTTSESLAAACADLLDADAGPNCIVVDVDPDEIPPFAPFLMRG